MTDYTSQSVLLVALRSNDCRTIRKCLHAGQNLNQTVGDWGEPLLMHAIQTGDEAMFLSLLAFKEHLDLRYLGPSSPTYFDYAVGNAFSFTHLLLQAGAAPEMTQFHYSKLEWASEPEFYYPYLMLLSAGLDPGNTIPVERIQNEVRRWLQGFDSAKQLLEHIFDNEQLQKEILHFVYNEENLRKIV